MQGKWRSRSWVRLSLTLALSLLAAAGITGSSREPGDESEGEPRPQLVRVDWQELRQSQQVVTAPALELIVENLSPFALTARVHVSADNGTTAPPATLMLQNVEIATGQARRLKVPIGSLRESDSLRRRAGGLRASVLACFANAAAGSDCQTISTPDWFMHVDSAGSLRIYDAATLNRSYRSGDLSLAGLPGEAVKDEDEIAHPNRVMRWVSPGSNLATSPDDNPPATEEVQK